MKLLLKLWAVLAILFVILSMCSCRTIEKTIEVEKHDTLITLVSVRDTMWKSIATHDTIRLRDSIVVYVDSLGREQIKYVYRDRDRAVYVHDTIYKASEQAAYVKKSRNVSTETDTTTEKKPTMLIIILVACIIGVVGFEAYRLIKKFLL